MKIASFARWVNEELLPNHALEPGYPRKVSRETARKWLHELGFCVFDSKKGTYVDGHEWQDVTEYHAKFLCKMVALGFLNSENAPTPEAALSLPKDIDTLSAEQITKPSSYSTMSQHFKRMIASVHSGAQEGRAHACTKKQRSQHNGVRLHQ